MRKIKGMKILSIVMCVIMSSTVLTVATPIGASSSSEDSVTSTGQWEKLNGPIGPHVIGVVIDPTNPKVFYGVLGGGGIYKSVDRGETWFEISAGVPELWPAAAVTLDPTNPQIVYAGAWNTGLYKTVDGGNTWEHLTEGLDIQNTLSIVIDPNNPQIIYFGSRSGVWKTMDGGNTWTQKNNGIIWTRIFTLAMDPIDHNIIYAGNIFGDSNYLYKSTNGGDSWVILDIGKDDYAQIWSIEIDPIDHLTIYVCTDAGLFKSNDGGGNWTENISGITNHFIRDITIDPTSHNKIYAATWGGVFKSIDAGSSSTLISQDFITPFTESVTLDLLDNQTIYVGIFGGVYKSVDDGNTWTLITEGLYQGPTPIANKCLAVDPDDSNILYAATFGGGVFKSINCGRTWVSINLGLDVPFCNGGLQLTSPTLYLGTDAGGVYKSTDGGETWSQKIDGLLGLSISHIEIDPSNHEIIYLAAGSIYKSIDGAGHWFPINDGLDDLIVSSIAIDPTDTQNIYITTTGWGASFKSRNGGETWINISNGLPYRTKHIALDPINPQVLYAGSHYNGMFKTIDGGNSWFAISNGLTGTGNGIRIQSLVLNPLNPQILYVGVFGNGIFKSTNGGETWIPWNWGVDDVTSTANALILDPNDPSIVYAGTYDGIFRWTSNPIKASIDIDPDELNPKSKGKWITCYIELHVIFDVNDIDISTVKISEINGKLVDIPAESHPTEIGDYDNDSIPDLMIKFSRDAAINAIPDDVSSESEVEIKVTGELTDGTVFEGNDTIRVI